MIKDDFLRYLFSVRGRGNLTIIAYKGDLNKFYEYLSFKYDIYNNEVVILKELKIIELDRFIDYLDKLGYVASTKNRKIACLKSYFKYLKRIDIIDFDITENLDNLKLAKKEPKYLTIEECEELLNNIKGENYVRDKAIITLFLTSGLRVSELTSLSINDISDNCITFLGKGNKWATLPLSEIAITAINNYLKIRPVVSHDALFISERRNRLSKRAIQSLVKKRLKEIGRDDCSTHTTRHSTASLLYQNGIDIISIQQILRHNNLSTTQIYTHLGGDALRNAVSSNPLNIK